MNAALPAKALKETAAWDNPMGLMGFEFVEFTSPQPGVLEAVFEKLGFTLVAKHRSKDVVLYRQNGINFILNANEVVPRDQVMASRLWPYFEADL